MMYFQSLAGVSCSGCGEEEVMYGTKEEASGWKVYVQCHPEDGCGRERMAGWVSRSDIDHIDEKSEKAEELARKHA